MNIKINGEPQRTELNNLSQLVDAFVDANKPYAIAVNENFIPKANYSNITISEGDSIEILSPMQGG